MKISIEKINEGDEEFTPGWYVWPEDEAPIGPFITKKLAERFVRVQINGGR